MAWKDLTARERITAASFDIMRDPEFSLMGGATQIGAVEMVAPEECPTAGTNGRDVVYCTPFVMGLTRPQVRMLVAHETAHKMLHHCIEYTAICEKYPQESNMAMDYCFVEGTRVTMADGALCAIEKIIIGDHVHTPFGAAKVLATKTRYVNDTIELDYDNGSKLECTPEHRFLTSKGYVHAAALTEEDLCYVDRSYGCATNGAARGTADKATSAAAGCLRESCVQSAKEAGACSYAQDAEEWEPEVGSKLDGCGSCIFCGASGRRGDGIVCHKKGQVPVSVHSCVEHVIRPDDMADNIGDARACGMEQHREAVLADKRGGDANTGAAGKDTPLREDSCAPLRHPHGNNQRTQRSGVSFPSDAEHHTLIAGNKDFEPARITNARRSSAQRCVIDITTEASCFIAEGVVVHNCVNLIVEELDAGRGFMEWIDEPPPLIDQKYKGQSFLEVLQDILKNPPPSNPKGGKGTPGPLDTHTQGKKSGQSGEKPLSEEEAQTLKQQMQDAVAQGQIVREKLQAKARGDKGSGGRFDAMNQQRTTDWKGPLRRFIAEQAEGDELSRFSPPNRRFLPLGLVMPSHYSERIGEIVIAADTSGSMYSVMPVVLGEIARICQQVKPAAVRMLFWDTAIAGDQLFTERDYDKIAKVLRPAGGGGTTVSVVADYIKQHKIKAKCVIYLTDGYLEQRYNVPPIPCLWGVVDNTAWVPSKGKKVDIFSSML